MHRGPELLCSATVPQLITALRPGYDVILVDSAPLAAGVDPYALGVATGNMLLVVRPDVTDRAIAEAKVEVLQRLPVRLLGAVLNDVRPGWPTTTIRIPSPATRCRKKTRDARPVRSCCRTALEGRGSSGRGK